MIRQNSILFCKDKRWWKASKQDKNVELRHGFPIFTSRFFHTVPFPLRPVLSNCLSRKAPHTSKGVLWAVLKKGLRKATGLVLLRQTIIKPSCKITTQKGHFLTHYGGFKTYSELFPADRNIHCKARTKEKSVPSSSSKSTYQHKAILRFIYSLIFLWSMLFHA